MEKQYFERNIDTTLRAWAKESNRKPLLLRGARQVGKSAAIKHLAQQFDYFVEVNFEEQKQVHNLFKGDLSPQELCENLAIFFKTPIIAGKTLLFFDEIQACIPAISALRFFYEKYPNLHLVAAGSLLEFALQELLSFGVGRVRSLFVYPFSFDEFLGACGELHLLAAKQQASLAKPLPEPIHLQLLTQFKRFLVLGGMPEIVATFATSQDLLSCQMALDDLIISLKADFGKYKKRVPSLRILEIFESVTRQMGGKFVYQKAAIETNHKQIKEAIELLIMAGLVIPVTHTSANGIPLGAESDVKKQKMLLLDTGIFQRLLGLDITAILFEEGMNVVNKGAIAELFVGLELLKAASCYQQQTLYYWHRETASSHAEIDYVVQQRENIIPIEVKSGRKGAMQSLHLFLKEKNSKVGVRFSLENYGMYDNIWVYPLYAVADFARK